ncbi:MAG: ribonuclease E activity regulator RraA [Burkholderiaceae bacterium]
MSYLTADLCDAHADKLAAGTLRVLSPVLPLKLGAAKTCHGQLVTLKVFEDNALVREQLGKPGAGRVLLVDGGGSTRRALVGGNLAKLGADNGWSGIIVFGAVRDADEIDACNLVIRAIATCPQPTMKKGEGAVNVPVEIAGLRIEPGQWLYEDRDGVLISAAKL